MTSRLNLISTTESKEGNMKKLMALMVGMILFAELTAEALSWDRPVTLSSEGIDASNPSISVDGLGNVHAVWLERDVIQSRTMIVGKDWGPSIEVSRGDNITSLQSVTDVTGASTALWVDAGKLKSSTQQLNQAWSSPIVLSGDGSSSNPVLAIDKTGNIVAVWVQTDSSNVVSLQSSTKLSGRDWQGSPDTISGSTVNASAPDAFIGSDGTVFAVWHSVSDTADQLNSVSKKINENVWSQPKQFFTPTISFRDNYPKVIVDSIGNAYTLWFRFNQYRESFSNVILAASQLKTGTSDWLTLEKLSEVSLKNPADFTLKLCIDKYDNLLAIWTSSKEGNLFDVETARKLFEGAWEFQGGTLLISNLYGYSADAGLDDDGDVVAVYMNFDGKNILIQASESHVASPLPNFWPSQQIISEGGQSGFPRVSITSVNEMDHVSAIWIQNDGTNNLIKAANATKPEVLPPSNLKVVQQTVNMGVLTEYLNKLTWDPSLDPYLESYAVYRNGIRIAIVDQNILEFVDNNAVQNSEVTYGIAALSTNFALSPLVIVKFP